MAITRRLLGADISPRSAGVLTCLSKSVIYDRCGWRCGMWVRASRYDERAGGSSGIEKRVHDELATHSQLTAELCEATPEPLPVAVSAALAVVEEAEVARLRDVGRRARFMLTTANHGEQRLASELLATLPGTWRDFERTVKAAAREALGAPQGRAAGAASS